MSEHQTVNAPGSFWDGAEIIHRYTRADALRDGVLFDVSEAAAAQAFRVPVAMTAGLKADIERMPAMQDYWGRLHDVLFMGMCAIRGATRRGETGTTLYYDLIMQVGRKTRYTVKMVSGPGDAGEHVITLMRPDED